MKTKEEQAIENAEVRANSVCRDYWATPMKDEGEAQRFLAMRITTAILDAQKEAVRGVMNHIKEAADRAYCEGCELSQNPLCLGEEIKLLRGSFTKENLNAHRYVMRKFGAYDAFNQFLTTYEQRNDEGRTE